MLRQKLVLISITLTIALLGALLSGCGTTGDAYTSTPPPPPPTNSSSLTVSPANWSFGQVAMGGSSSKSVTLTNTGNTAVSILAANVTGSEYSVSGITFPRSVAVGGSTTATINFAPQATGNSSGSVSFASDATNSPALVSVSGSGFTPTAHSVDLTWNASTATVDGYHVFRSTQSGTGYALISGQVAVTSFTDNNVESGQRYFYVVTAVASGAESAFSNESSALIPIP